MDTELSVIVVHTCAIAMRNADECNDQKKYEQSKRAENTGLYFRFENKMQFSVKFVHTHTHVHHIVNVGYIHRICSRLLFHIHSSSDLWKLFHLHNGERRNASNAKISARRKWRYKREKH